MPKTPFARLLSPPPPPKHKRSKGFDGFTLAETLITLAIIGIIAALTIPNLLRNYERAKLEAQFKHAYKFISQGIERTYLENGDEFVPTSATIPNGGDNSVAKAMNYLADNYWGGKAKNSIVTRNSAFSHYDGSAGTSGCAVIETTLKNGMSLTIRNGCYNGFWTITKDVTIGALIVDVNGSNKGPNRWGYDVWSYNIDMKNHKLVPDGALGKYNGHDPYKCGSRGQAKFDEDYGCTYYAIINQCPDDPSKTYWQCLKL